MARQKPSLQEVATLIYSSAILVGTIAILDKMYNAKTNPHEFETLVRSLVNILAERRNIGFDQPSYYDDYDNQPFQ
ncbi:MAG: hypothetical protein HQK83_19915 [Fibrobacteria bacterium]|nr:hypothetical protein [Fibrobacteria bacterium]